MPLQAQKSLYRGGTAYWETTFYDINGQVAQPQNAFINLNFPNPDGSRGTEEFAMTPPALGVVFWTVFIDTRDMGIGPVNWSIHTGGAIPVAVEDGSFQLTANTANLVDFP